MPATFSRVVLAVASLMLCGSLMTATEMDEKREDAPPKVKEALEAAVSKFYQAHVDGKFRLADQYVAEDSKDAFFEAAKTRFQGFEIVRLLFSEDLKRARAVISVDSEFVMPLGASRIPVKNVFPSFWKLENGEWRWYVRDQDKQRAESPFGELVAKEGSSGGQIPAQTGNVDALLRGVEVKKNEILFPAGQPSEDTVEIVNHMPGMVKLKVESPMFLGLDFVLDKAELQANEKATLKITWQPKTNSPKPPVPAKIIVEPTQQMFDLTVKFAAPAKE